MRFIPVLSKNVCEEQAKAGRFVLLMHDEGNWAIFKILQDWKRGDPSAIFIDNDNLPEDVDLFSGHGDFVIDTDERTGYEPYVMTWSARAFIDTLDEAKAVAVALHGLDKKFTEETREPRISYQLGALSAINSGVPALLRHRA